METQEVETKELQPRGKILFINMGVSSDKPSFKIASGMFGREGVEVAAFNEMMLTRVETPASLEGEKLGSLRQIRESSLYLPRVDEVSAVVISGSALSGSLLTRDLSVLGVAREGKGVFLPKWQRELADFIKEANLKGKPMLGICFGAEMITEALGGKVVQMKKAERGFSKEVGYSLVHKTSGADDSLLRGLPGSFVAITNHNREIIKVPDGAQVLAENRFGVQVFRIGESWGLQFHPEKTIKDAEKLLSTPENQEKFNPTEQEKLKGEFNGVLMQQILQNFLRISAGHIS